VYALDSNPDSLSRGAQRIADFGVPNVSQLWYPSRDPVAQRAAVTSAFEESDVDVIVIGPSPRTDSAATDATAIEDNAEYLERALIDIDPKARRARKRLERPQPRLQGACRKFRPCRAHGGHAVLVSGGFTRFADPVGAEIGFDRVVANRLGLGDGMLDGTVAEPIVGAATKRETLLAALAERGWSRSDALAVGDGANDIPMIEAAGLGVAYHAKPRTRAAASAGITNGDLTTILYAMGYPRAEWVD
jgi:HAD superfamily phosphoserine phosphatase-like hydrolase